MSTKNRKRRRHTPEQIIIKLREADAMLGSDKTIGQMVQYLEVSEATLHRWRNQYGEIDSFSRQLNTFQSIHLCGR